uniref:RRM domain-containing protein n=1 Tax=Cucumis melo TaxID=3656 RepID=A0A9I9DUP8_CUCME
MAHHPYDPYYLYNQPDPTYSDRSNINTLFISGLPDDVKAREIHNLFRRRPGFDSCQLKYTGRGNQVVAFATFYNHQSAVTALHALNGVKFDPQSGSVLHIELARSNSRRKHKPGGSEPDEPSKKAQQSNEAVVTPASAISAPYEHHEKNDGGPCSTLFIANLGPNCNEDELKEVLCKYPGFNVLKLRAKSGMPVAFADFEDIEQASKVMEELQGSVLPSSDRGGMHIEYARSKMRKS